MIIGKEKRLQRLFNGNENIVILPMDHGFTDGPIQGIENVGNTLSNILECNCVDSVILHRGIIIHNYEMLTKHNLGLIMHLSASTSLYGHGLHKVQIGTVDEAISLGCDAVSVHVNLGNQYEASMLSDVGKIAEECDRKGMPLLAMVYVRDDEGSEGRKIQQLKQAVRVAYEIGADLVKVNYCLSGDDFYEVVNGCQIPVIIAGGKPADTSITLKMISDAMKAGARGVAMGRNVFQSRDYQGLLTKIDRIVHHHESIIQGKGK